MMMMQLVIQLLGCPLRVHINRKDFPKKRRNILGRASRVSQGLALRGLVDATLSRVETDEMRFAG